MPGTDTWRCNTKFGNHISGGSQPKNHTEQLCESGNKAGNDSYACSSCKINI